MIMKTLLTALFVISFALTKTSGQNTLPKIENLTYVNDVSQGRLTINFDVTDVDNDSLV